MNFEKERDRNVKTKRWKKKDRERGERETEIIRQRDCNKMARERKTTRKKKERVFERERANRKAPTHNTKAATDVFNLT